MPHKNPKLKNSSINIDSRLYKTRSLSFEITASVDVPCANGQSTFISNCVERKKIRVKLFYVSDETEFFYSKIKNQIAKNKSISDSLSVVFNIDGKSVKLKPALYEYQQIALSPKSIELLFLKNEIPKECILMIYNKAPQGLYVIKANLLEPQGKATIGQYLQSFINHSAYVKDFFDNLILAKNNHEVINIHEW